MRWIRLAAATVNQTPLDWSGNATRIREATAEARRRGAALVVFPELSLSGYGCEDVFHGLAHSERAMAELLKLAPASAGCVLVVGVPVRLHHGLYDCAAFLIDGRVAGIVAKQHLAGDGVHYEPRWFRPWQAGRHTTVEIDGREVPFGDIVFDIAGVRVGAEICEDAWVPDRPGRHLARVACDIVVNPSASHFSFGKSAIRERIVTEGSRAMGVAYVYANLLGNEAGRVVYEGDRLIATGGEVVARGARFSFAPWAVLDAVVDLDVLRMRRDRTTSFVTDEATAAIVDVSFEWPADKLAPARPIPPAEEWSGSTFRKEEEFARAVALGLFDYLRKSGSRGFIVSLSGGADSAAVATLSSLAWRFAAGELGAEAAAARLAPAKVDVASLSGGLLETAYQSTRNSGPVTRAAACAVAEGVGARHHEWDVTGLVDAYTNLAQDALGRPLAWETDDIALQNIQARVRAPGVWMLANVRGALLLSTSNRSEAAVGYATMDGDTCGSISPIAGIDKNYLRSWLRWMAERGPAGIGSVPGLMEVCTIPPTAELRPPGSHQTDEADLMPYDLLDAIERLAIRDRLSPGQVLDTLEGEWSDRLGGRDTLAESVGKFFRLFCRNQWKRERYAPSFHLDDENLDPKTWCRFPILSGGYREEIGEMKQ